MVMTVLLHDAMSMLSEPAKAAYAKGDLWDVVYADDTLLMGVNDDHLNEYLHAVFAAGQKYGMELHWSKFQVLPTQCTAKIATPDGTNIEEKPSMEYLGTVLHADGSNDHELNRRIGMAKADFLKLSKVWSHSSCTWPKKVRIFSALIESKLLYTLRN